MEGNKNLKYYKLGNTIQEFEEIFGNVPIDSIDKIKKYLFENYIPKSLVKEKIEELKGTEELLSDEQGYWGGSDLLAKIDVLEELLREE